MQGKCAYNLSLIAGIDKPEKKKKENTNKQTKKQTTDAHTHKSCCCEFKQNLLLCAVSLPCAAESMGPTPGWELSVTETYPRGTIITQTQLFRKGY